jgi:ribose 5-phosphate isomerase B
MCGPFLAAPAIPIYKPDMHPLGSDAGRGASVMKIALGSDHRGYEAKQFVLSLVAKEHHQVEDFGCHSVDAVDYPDIAYAVGMAVAGQSFDVGILLGGTGMGMCMAANKIHGILAANVPDEFAARRAREHYNCNIICVAADLHGSTSIEHIVRAFLSAKLARGRHARRVKKIQQIEQGINPAAS